MLDNIDKKSYGGQRILNIVAKELGINLGNFDNGHKSYGLYNQNREAFTNSFNNNRAISSEPTDITCCIADQGIGIPEKNIPKIFDRFYRIDESRNSQTGGVGVGLSIVKKLADLQQITLAVQSIPNIGTKFMLNFLSA